LPLLKEKIMSSGSPMDHRVDQEIVASICRMVDLGLPPERVALLTPHVQGILALLAVLDELDLDEVEPATVFSAEWR
jgi:Asp-tRNA(Asn)/Glu-tRNA(Gln) amidotransferase C subunit